MNRMKHSTSHAVALLLVIVLAGAVRTGAEPAATENDRLLTYIVQLRPDLDPRKHKEPEVDKFGGKEKERWGNRRVVTLPRQAIEALSRHEAVWFLALVNDGEPTEAPKYVFNPTLGESARFETRTEATTTPPTWDSGEYAYDGSGNIKSIGTGTAMVDAFTYDRAGRLVTAVTSGAPTTYVYDSFGNQYQRTYGSETVTTNTDLGTNRLSDATYDIAGNQLTTAGDTETRTFDAANMMVTRQPKGESTDRYIYTADDERIGTRHGSEWDWTIRDFNGKPLTWFESAGPAGVWSWDRDAYYAGSVLAAGLAVQDGPIGGRNRYYHRDHLGNTRLITNWRAQRISGHDFYPFGKEKTSLTQERTDWLQYDEIDKLKFTGHERDFANYYDPNRHDYLDYMHARYYSSATGRFLSVDPTWASADLGKPQSWNRYSYVQNNPINRIDPDGRADVGLDCVPASVCTPAMKAAVREGHTQALKVTAVVGVVVLLAVLTRGDIVLGPSAGEPDAPSNARARQVADAEQASGRRGGTAGTLTATDGRTFSDTSAPNKQLHPDVQKALDNVPAEQRSAYHGNCAEPGCVSKALNDGANPAGGEMETAKIRGPNSPSHGQPHNPCSTCKLILDFFGIKYRGPDEPLK